jgi:PPOX class probable F420-dependent enzyme
MPSFSLEGLESLLEGPSPAVLTTYRKDATALVSPVWFRWTGEAFEVVIAEDDVKVRQLTRNPTCALVVFEAARPFRGVEARGHALLRRGDVSEARASIASRFLGAAAGERFGAQRASRPGVLLQLHPDTLRSWDLRAILPD